MMKSLFRSSATLALLFAPLAHAQEAAPAAPAAPVVVQDADPALWVVQDDDTTIYLFGTVHLLKPGLSWFDEAVRQAFDKSDQVVLEMVQPDDAAMQGLVMSKGFNATGPSLTDKLPEDKRPEYAAAMQSIGIPATAFDRFDPWLAAVTLGVLPLQKLGYDPTQGPEAVLTKAAADAGKPLVGLETAEQQLGYFDDLPQDQQVSYLVTVVENMGDAGKTLDKMVDAWSKGQPDTLGTIMSEEMRETPGLAKVLLTDRNIRWADWIAHRLDQPGVVFIAVGAGHLAGSDSVQAQLAKLKIKVRRIEY
ncbi:MAG: TraB/GumN family protein [Pseudomonadota bacterium]